MNYGGTKKKTKQVEYMSGTRRHNQVELPPATIKDATQVARSVKYNRILITPVALLASYCSGVGRRVSVILQTNNFPEW